MGRIIIRARWYSTSAFCNCCCQPLEQKYRLVKTDGLTVVGKYLQQLIIRSMEEGCLDCYLTAF